MSGVLGDCGGGCGGGGGGGGAWPEVSTRACVWEMDGRVLSVPAVILTKSPLSASASRRAAQPRAHLLRLRSASGGASHDTCPVAFWNQYLPTKRSLKHSQYIHTRRRIPGSPGFGARKGFGGRTFVVLTGAGPLSTRTPPSSSPPDHHHTTMSLSLQSRHQS